MYRGGGYVRLGIFTSFGIRSHIWCGVIQKYLIALWQLRSKVVYLHLVTLHAVVASMFHHLPAMCALYQPSYKREIIILKSWKLVYYFLSQPSLPTDCVSPQTSRSVVNLSLAASALRKFNKHHRCRSPFAIARDHLQMITSFKPTSIAAASTEWSLFIAAGWLDDLLILRAAQCHHN